MGILEILTKAAADSGNSFLVIGGYAVNAHGYPRVSADLDLLTARSQCNYWRSRILESGYDVFGKRGNFMQFARKEVKQVPVDLLLVSDATFQKLISEAIEGLLGEANVMYPSLRHLIALKTEVMKHAVSYRQSIEFVDIVQLAQIHSVDVSHLKYPRRISEIENMAETPKGESERKRDLISPANLELELPDAPDFESQIPPFTMEQVIYANRSVFGHKWNSKEEAERRLSDKCDIEFRMD